MSLFLIGFGLNLSLADLPLSVKAKETEVIMDDTSSEQSKQSSDEPFDSNNPGKNANFRKNWVYLDEIKRQKRKELAKNRRNSSARGFEQVIEAIKEESLEVNSSIQQPNAVSNGQPGLAG